MHPRPQPSRDNRAKSERLRVEQRRLPCRRLVEESEQRARGDAAGCFELDRRGSWRFGAGREEAEVDAERDDPVVTLEPLVGFRASPRKSPGARRSAFARRSRRERRAGYPSRSTEKNVAAVSAWVEVSARYEGSAGRVRSRVRRRSGHASGRGEGWLARPSGRPCWYAVRPGSKARRR